MHFRGGFKNCARLHFGNLRINNAEAATAMTQHRIEFMQLVNTARDLFNVDAQFVGQFVLLRVVVGQEFVQRRIEKTDRRRKTFERLEDAMKILALVRQQLGERGFELVALRADDDRAIRQIIFIPRNRASEHGRSGRA